MPPGSVKKAGRASLTFQPVRAEGASRRTCLWKGLIEAVRGKFQSTSTSFLRIFHRRSKACLLFACNGNRLKDHSILMPFMIGLGWRPLIDKRQQWVTYRKGLYDVGLPFPSFSNASFNTLCTFATDVNEVHPSTFTVKFRSGNCCRESSRVRWGNKQPFCESDANEKTPLSSEVDYY